MKASGDDLTGGYNGGLTWRVGRIREGNFIDDCCSDSYYIQINTTLDWNKVHVKVEVTNYYP